MDKLVRKIGLVAHDAMKKDLIEWALWNSELLMGHKFYCTGTTGTLILEALKEKLYRSHDLAAARYGCQSLDTSGWCGEYCFLLQSQYGRPQHFEPSLS